MAEEKRGRGRPKKKAAPIINEEEKQITMSSKEQKSIEMKQGVGAVREVPDTITLNALQQRWRDVFRDYGSLGFEAISNAWGKNVNFLNNPFLQNNRIKKINSPVKKLSKEEMQ